MTLSLILEGSRDVVKNVAGITSAYKLLPEKAPEDAKLPCAIQEVVEGDVLWATQQEHLIHRWYLDVLVSREGDARAETEGAITFVPLVIAQYRTNMALGLAASGVRNCRPLRYEKLVLSIFQTAYVAIRFHMQAEEKYAVTLSA